MPTLKNLSRNFSSCEAAKYLAKKEGLKECAEIVERMMKEVGLSTKVIPFEEFC